ncbi:MAG: SRPBCC domain-containing protein [Actinomycetota bacterium]
MSYELRIERLFDAPPEIVFDTLVDPDAQDELFNDQVEGWKLLEFEIDLRVGGTWTIVFGPADGQADSDRITNVFTDIDRPRRLSYEASMYVGEWGRTVDFTETFTFEEQDGKTLLTVVQSGFETEADRDAFMSGTPGFLDALQRVVAARVAGTEERS